MFTFFLFPEMHWNFMQGCNFFFSSSFVFLWGAVFLINASYVSPSLISLTRISIHLKWSRKVQDCCPVVYNPTIPHHNTHLVYVPEEIHSQNCATQMDPSCHLSLVTPWWEFVQETVITALYFCWVLMSVHCNFILIPGIGMDILWPYSLKIWTLESGKMTLRNRPTRRRVSIWQSLPQRPSYWHCSPLPPASCSFLPGKSVPQHLSCVQSGRPSLQLIMEKRIQIAWEETASFIFPLTDTQLQSSPTGFPVTSCPETQEQSPPSPGSLPGGTVSEILHGLPAGCRKYTAPSTLKNRPQGW